MNNDSFPADTTPELPAIPPAWPKVIGIISIVWGSIGLVCGGCGIASPFFMGVMLQGQGELPPSLSPTLTQMALMAFGLLLAILLIVAGVTTMNRKPAGFIMHIGYAVVSIPVTLLGLYFSWKQQAELAQWAVENPDNMIAKSMSARGRASARWSGWSLSAHSGWRTRFSSWCGSGSSRSRGTWGLQRPLCETAFDRAA